MPVSVTTRASKGSPLAWSELDANFTNLRDGIEANTATIGTSVSTLQAAQAAGIKGFQTKATMDASLAFAANTMAIVTNDPTVSNNTYWIKLGASGTGSWQKSNMTTLPNFINAGIYADLNTAVAAQGANLVILVITSSISVTSTVTVPSTCGLWIVSGGNINVAAGTTLTVNGAFVAEPVTVFTGTGNVVLGSNVAEADAAWFAGDFNKALVAMTAGNVVASGNYTVTAPIVMKKVGVGLKGKNALSITSTYDGAIIQIGDGVSPIYRFDIADLRIIGTTSCTNQIGLKFNGISNSVYTADAYVKRVVMDGVGGTFIQADYSWTVVFSECEIGVGGTNPGKLINLLSSNVNHFTFRDCKLMRSQFAGYAITLRGIRHTITRCQIEFNSNTLGVIEVGDSIAAAEQVTISECWIADNTGSNSYIATGGNSNTTIDIKNCTFTKSDSVTMANAIDIQRGNPSISNNTFRGTWTAAIITLSNNVPYALIQHNLSLSGATTTKIVTSAIAYLFNFAFNDSTWGRLITNNQIFCNSSFKMERASTGDTTFYLTVTGDAGARFAARAGGALEWGDGTGTIDVSMNRVAANVLSLAAGDSLGVGTISGSSGTLGAISKKMPIYNEAGALQGYIPILATLP